MRRKLVLSVLIAAALLALAAAFIDREKFLATMATMHAGWLVPVVGLLLLTQIVRAVRYGLIVRGVADVSMARVIPVCVLGYLAINVLPLRAGEFVRPLALRARDGIPFPAGLATIIAERVLDALSVFALLMISLALVPETTITIGGESWDLRVAARVLLVLFAPMALFLVALVVLRERLVSLVERTLRPVSARLASLAGRILGTFVAGLGVFRTAGRTTAVVSLTVLVWALQTLAMGIGFALFALDAPASAAVPVLAITMAGITVPAGIGMSGNFQVFCMAALALYAIDPARALAYAVVMNGAMFAVAVGMGVAVMPFLQLRLSALVRPPVDLAKAAPSAPHEIVEPTPAGAGEG